MYGKFLVAIAIGIVSFGTPVFAQAPGQAVRPPDVNAQNMDEVAKRIEAERKRFEKEQKETEELFDQTQKILQDQHKEIQQAAKAVDDMIARLEATIGKTGDKGELTEAIDLMIGDAIDGKSQAESIGNEALIQYFSALEQKYRDAKQRLSDARIDALGILTQLKAQKDVITLAAKARALEQAYVALDAAVNKFKAMVESGKAFLQTLPRPPGS